MQASRQQKSVMMALAPESVPRLAAAVEGRYDLHWPHSVMQAQAMLEHRHIDLVICGVLFDDSRMLDLLQYCKSSERLARIPFVGVRARRGRLPIDSLRDLVVASSALGASGFVDFEQWVRALGEAEATLQMQRLVDGLLGEA